MTPLLHADEVAWLRQSKWPWVGVSRAGVLATHAAPHGARGYEPEIMRPYQMGDDVRMVDWSATVRMQRAMVRQPQSMHHGSMRIIVDASTSMATPPRKWHATLRMVAALGIIALAPLHRLQLMTATSETWYTQQNTWLDACEQLRTVSHTTSFVLPSLTFTAQPAVLCSDLWHDDWYATLTHFAMCTDQGVCLHLLDTNELTPDLNGEITLIDSETHQQRTMTIDETARNRYHGALQQRLADIRTACQRLAVQYVLIDAGYDVLHALAEVHS